MGRGGIGGTKNGLAGEREASKEGDSEKWMKEGGKERRIGVRGEVSG